MCKQLLLLFLFAFGSLEAQNTWQKKASFGGGDRGNACGFAIGNTGYILSGTDTGLFFTDMWSWNADSDSWKQVASYPGGNRVGLNSVVCNGSAYVIAGGKPSNCFGKVGGGVCGLGFFKDIWMYNPEARLWSYIDSSFPGKSRAYAVAVTDPVHEVIYFGTGDDNGTSYLSDWWAFNTKTRTWKIRTNFPGGPRDNAVGFYLNGKIYVGTGNNNDSVNNASNDFWEYTPSTNRWKRIADIPGIPLRCASAFTIGNYGYVCLGIGDTSYTSAGWRYDPSTNSWLKIADYPLGAIANAVAFTIGTNAYIGTGSNNSYYFRDLWAYTADDMLGVTIPTPAIAVNIYPNPSKTTASFKFSGIPALPAQLTIVDLLGNIVSSANLTQASGQFSLNVSELNSGIYFYRIFSGENQLKSGKFLISR